MTISTCPFCLGECGYTAPWSTTSEHAVDEHNAMASASTLAMSYGSVQVGDLALRAGIIRAQSACLHALADSHHAAAETYVERMKKCE